MNTTNIEINYLNSFVADYIIKCLFGSYGIHRQKQRGEKINDINMLTRIYYLLNQELTSNLEIILNKPQFEVDEDFFLTEFRDEFHQNFEIYWSDINSRFKYSAINSEFIKKLCDKINNLLDVICYIIQKNKSLTFYRLEKIIKKHFDN